jgi:hypothetical protein
VYSQASRADFSLELKLRRRDLSELRFVCNGQLREEVEVHVGRDQVVFGIGAGQDSSSSLIGNQARRQAPIAISHIRPLT